MKLTWSGLLNNLYISYLKRKLKGKVYFDKNCKISSDDIFEGNNSIGGTVVNSYIGYGTYTGRGCEIKCGKIGRYCSIAPDVKFIRGQHPTSEFVSTSPAFYLKTHVIKSYVDKNLFEPYKTLERDSKYSVKIGNDVWIGQGAGIVDRVQVGDGAIIAAGAIVTKDIPAYAVVGGVPAKVIKYRFEADIIQKLLEIQWWNHSEEWIKVYAGYFNHVDQFIKKLEENKEI